MVGLNSFRGLWAQGLSLVVWHLFLGPWPRIPVPDDEGRQPRVRGPEKGGSWELSPAVAALLMEGVLQLWTVSRN